ncbi:MAG: hypothetical protein COA82_02585 [Alkaliphilus sp.]|nr:hypothetical protein [bacterium AH-315-G05]PHS35928.1 MAG: hypothetical protein COA82_02585 [Alkaliphilus sp.]
MRSSLKVAIDLLYFNRAGFFMVYIPFVVFTVAAFLWGYFVEAKYGGGVLFGANGLFGVELSSLTAIGIEGIGLLFLMLYIPITLDGNLKFLRAFNVTRKKYFTGNLLSILITAVDIAITLSIVKLVFRSLLNVHSLYGIIFGGGSFMGELIWLISLNLFMASLFYLYSSFVIWHVKNAAITIVLMLAPAIIMISAVTRFGIGDLVEQIAIRIQILSQSLLLGESALMILAFGVMTTICLLMAYPMLKKTSVE